MWVVVLGSRTYTGGQSQFPAYLAPSRVHVDPVSLKPCNLTLFSCFHPGVFHLFVAKQFAQQPRSSGCLWLAKGTRECAKIDTQVVAVHQLSLLRQGQASKRFGAHMLGESESVELYRA